MAHLKGLLGEDHVEVLSVALKVESTGDGFDSAFRLEDLESCSAQDQPGRVVVHKLNNAEYNNSVRQLLPLPKSFVPGSALIEDGAGLSNFRNDALALSITPLAFQKYLDAAEASVNQAFSSSENEIRICNGKSVSKDQLSRNCVTDLLQSFAEQAFRRPLESHERSKLDTLIDATLDQGQDLDTAIKVGMQWALISPNFLYRSIISSNPGSASDIHVLTGYELATRLSYFLWSSSPDEGLRAQAEAGTLLDNIDTQIDRMLADPRAQALVDNFADQWMELPHFESAAPDPSAFPEFSEALRRDMMTETHLLFEDVFQNDQSLMQLVSGRHSYLNERLSKHYGFGGVTGNNQWTKVELPEDRFGVVTQGTVLTLTSGPDQTSLVLRGKWVMDNLLCESPPPPPANVDTNLDPNFEGSLRERIAAHRSSPECAACHESMDNIGFSMERFNAIGQTRENYEDGTPIDESGRLPDGRNFDGPSDLAEVLSRDPLYRVCVVKKLMTYALGRELTDADECTVNRIAKDHVGDEHTFSDLVKAVVKSDPFRKQQGGTP